MQADRTMAKPSIMIGAVPHPEYERKLREVQAGMEEEGVPYSLTTSGQLDAVSLAYQSAGQSQLGVGVGISPEAICVHYYKLPAEQPLFVTGSADDASEWRRLGYNAARLVKGIPFKDQQLDTAAPAEGTADLYQLIRTIVMKVLRENAQAMGR